ncbi:MAG: hypothetical protein PHV02_13810 [Rhodocyclaceae bacterium]|nr:hypothetical protein [Rhodocyclaceae bacterium]
MAFADNFPINESLGVFLGVTGVDWLADGQAEPLKAIAISVTFGIVVLLLRKWSKRSNKD